MNYAEKTAAEVISRTGLDLIIMSSVQRLLASGDVGFQPEKLGCADNAAAGCFSSHSM
jgi:hypothetical protein